MAKIPYITEALKNIFKSPVTEKYPFVKIDVPEGYRGKIKYDPDACIGCGLCMRVCSPGAITKTMKKIDRGQEITLTFDMGSCTFCKMCADFCPKNAIEFTKDYSIVATNKQDLIISGTFIKKLPPRPAVKPKPNIDVKKAAEQAAAAKKKQGSTSEKSDK